MAPPGKLETVVTYLEMTERPAARPIPPPPAGARLDRVETPDVAFYRFLYDTIGEDWLWIDRRKLADAELGAIIGDARVEVHVLTVAGETAGYVELDRRAPPDVEIAYLGVMPGFIGRGLGRFLLARAVGLAWADPGTRRVWLHTCNFDHPKAIAFYREGGFRVYATEVQMIDDPRLTGLVPRAAAPHVPLAGEP